MSTNGKTLKFRAAKLKGFTVINLCAVYLQSGPDIALLKYQIKVTNSNL